MDNLPEASECVFINHVGRDRVIKCGFQGPSSFLRFFGGRQGYEADPLKQKLTDEPEDNLNAHRSANTALHRYAGLAS